MAMNPRLLRPLATGFSPRRISGLVAWWDAQVSSSYDIATGVAEWRDLSGNNHTLTQSTPNNQPTLSTINGKTAFFFDGSNDDMQAASAVLTGITQASAFSFFGVTQGRAAQGGYIVSNSGTNMTGAGVYSTTGAYNLYYGTGPTSPAVSATRSATAAEVWGLTHNNQVAQIGVNGTLQSAVTITSTTGVPTENMTVGNRSGGSSEATLFDGEIGSLLIYNRALSLTERSRLERWLGQRWGITVA
jgi:hypothetical protein